MDTVRKFMIYGPEETLKRFAPAFKADTKPQFSYKYSNKDNSDSLFVNIYEEHQKLINSSTTVTVIVKSTADYLAIDFVVTGGRMGFRGSSYGSDNIEPMIQETVYDYVVDFSKRHGLTIQENKPAETPESDA